MGTIDGYKIRRLTPLECFRLQGFPDEMLVTAKQLGIADTHLCTEKDIEDYTKRTQCSEVVFQFIIFRANVFLDER